MPSAQGIRAGAAYIELYLHDNRLQRGLSRASKRLQAFGASVQSMGMRVLALGGLVAGPLALTVKAASDMEETMNKFNVVFGDNAESVKSWGDLLASQIGRSREQIARFMAGTQDLLVPIGFEPGAATSMSKQLTQLAIDLASFNNLADDDVLRDLHAALTGSGEVMKKYGVIVSEAAVKQELLNQGIDPKRANDQQKVMARMAIIMRGTTAAQGDAVRSSGSFANQMKALKARLSDAAVEIGSALLPVITPMVASFAKAVTMAADWIRQNRQLVVIVFKVASAIMAAGAALVVLGGLISGAGSVIGFMAGVVGAVGTAIAILVKIVAFFLTPIGLVILAVVALGALLLYVSGLGAKALQWLAERFEVLKTRALAAWKGISDALAAGDLNLAAKILWLSLKLEWKRGVHYLNGVWVDFKSRFLSIANDAIFGAARIFNDGWAAIEIGWVETIDFLSDSWSLFTNMLANTWRSTVGFIEKAWVRLKSVFDKDMDVAAEVKQIDDETANANEAANQQMLDTIGQRDRERKNRREQIEADRAGAEMVLGEMQREQEQQRQAQFAGELASTEQELADARREWQQAIGEAAEKRAAIEPGRLEEIQNDLSLSSLALGDEQRKVEAKGTFNALAVRGIGADSLAERTANAAEEIAENTQDLLDRAKQGRLVFAK